MRAFLFPKLAWQGIRKNRRVYVPYILACMGMVMMSYILQSLSYCPLLNEMRGGGTLQGILSMGKIVVAVFALIFLLYTNAFLIRHRNREFGLYNVLGMDKRGLRGIIAWESLYVALISLVGGFGLGIAFSKMAELGLLKILRLEGDYRFRIYGESITFVLGVFVVIFLALLGKSLIDVSRQNPLELLRSTQQGEKPPKANWLLALLGAALLGTAYYMAVSTDNPAMALTLFFIAVIMVIVATYMLFTAGSVTFCRLLQKNKHYYYKKNHFVSVSTMAYRMKRNGMGLASICILSTMVLVMLTSSSSLYIGMEDVIRTRFSRDNFYEVNMKTLENLKDENVAQLLDGFTQTFEEYGVEPQNVEVFRFAGVTGELRQGEFDPDAGNMDSYIDSNLRSLYFINQEDYNRCCGTEISLEPGQALLYLGNCQYDRDIISCKDFSLRIVGQVKECPTINDGVTSVVPYMILVISDFDQLKLLEKKMDGKDGQIDMLYICWHFGYDLNVDEETEVQVYKALENNIMNAPCLQGYEGFGWSSDCLELDRDDYLSMFGGLFFIGIILSIVFVFAAILIIYYKQLSEGYEDQQRFVIMQKVGMTKQDIRKTVNSQILTVFFAPLLMGGLHLAFAFPMVWRMLQLFMLNNLSLVIWVNIGGFLVFGVLYAIVYRITSHVYYSIVSARPVKA